MTSRAIAAIAAGAVTALAVWPHFAANRATAASPAAAPVLRDYLTRDQMIRFYERQVRIYPADQIQARILASQYLQRYRERYDPGDVARAEAAARRSIALQPQGNTAAQMTVAAALLAKHDFRAALVHEREAWYGEPSNRNALAQIASLLMELGRYEDARAALERIAPQPAENPTVDAVKARYLELTGGLQRARSLIDAASSTVDSSFASSAYNRAWYHTRAAQLAFEAGDFTRAEAELRIALDMYPDDATALMWQARLDLVERRWQEALDASKRSAALYPLPQTLGYEADAERALGRSDEAKRTDALIDAEQRLFNSSGVNDRLLAMYYARRHTHLAQALHAARSDLARRGDEIYADDTMAWVLAACGRWSDAARYMQRALRYGTEDPELRYHAREIAMHVARP